MLVNSAVPKGICLAGLRLFNRNQQLVIDYLQEEVKVPRGTVRKNPRFTDTQCRRLAAPHQRSEKRSVSSNRPRNIFASVRGILLTRRF